MITKASTAALRLIDGWGRQVHERAVDNARAAATEATRRRVEAAEVELYLAGRSAPPARTAVPFVARA